MKNTGGGEGKKRKRKKPWGGWSLSATQDYLFSGSYQTKVSACCGVGVGGAKKGGVGGCLHGSLLALVVGSLLVVV